MKRLFLLIITVVLTHIATAQNSIFAAYENNDEVTTVVVTKKAFLMLKKVSSESKEADEFRNLVSGLDELRVLTTENLNVAGELRASFDQYLKQNKLVELMRVKDKDANVKIFVKEGQNEDYVTEFLMLVDQMDLSVNVPDRQKPELVIVSLTGNINLNDIAKITEDMNIPGSKHVQKAGKK